MNAVIGDNGIITRAMSAKQKSGMAALEEYLQQKYIEFFEESENYVNKPELLAAKMKNLLLKDGSKNYVTYNGNMYYLINKINLPEEIKEQLVGGDTTEYSKYIRLQDVYGITSNLKVYYCPNDGLNGEVLGNIENLEVNPKAKAELANKNEGLKEQLRRNLLDVGIDTGTNDLTIGDLNSIKDLILDSTSGLTSLSGISEVSKLKNLVLKDLNLQNLDGIERCSLLESIYFDNCTLSTDSGYDKLTTVLGLKKLYFRFPNSRDAEDVKREVDNFSSSLSKATELFDMEYFGIFGDSGYTDKTVFSFDSDIGKYSYHSELNSNLDDISSLENFASNIKSTIQYLYLNNNNLKDISCLSDFSKLYEVVLVDNPNLPNLIGLGNHSNLKYLISGYTGISNLEGINGSNNIIGISVNDSPNLNSLSNLRSENIDTLYAKNCNLTDIETLNNCTTLKYLNLENNPELHNIGSIKKLSNLTECYLGGNLKLDETVLSNVEFQDILSGCGSRYSLDSKYSLLFLNQPKLDLKNNNLTDDQLELLRGKTGICGIRLTGNGVLSNNKIVDILKSLTGLQVIDLYGCSQVTDISFVSELKNLIHLDLRGTAVTDFSLLENLATQGKLTLGCLLLDNSNIDLTKIQKTISTVSKNYKSSNFEFIDTGSGGHLSSGICISNPTLVSQLENCRDLTLFKMYSSAHDWSSSGTANFSNCDNLTEIVERWGYYQIINSDSVKIFTSETSKTHDFTECASLVNYSHSYCGFDLNTEISSLKNALNLSTFSAVSNTGNNNSNVDITPLSNTKVVSISMGRCSSLEKITLTKNIESLKTLDFKYCDKFKGDLNFINYLPKIESLVINNNPLITTLVGLENRTNLNTLTANNCSINNIKSLLSDNNLLTCDLSSNKISSLDGVQNLTSLTTLNLSNNSISDLYYLGLLADQRTISLQSLQLSNNNLENNSVISIDKSGNGQLETVYVDNIDIIKKLHDKGVTSIDVSNNNFSDTSELSKISGVKY